MWMAFLPAANSLCWVRTRTVISWSRKSGRSDKRAPRGGPQSAENPQGKRTSQEVWPIPVPTR